MRYYLTVLGLLLVASCKNASESSHLPQKVMANVLIDINIAEAYSTMEKDSLHRPLPKNYDSLGSYYKTIFNHYKITQQQFDESFTWYKNHPDKLDSVYAIVLPIVTKWQNEGKPVAAPVVAPPTMPHPPAMPPRPRR